MSMTVYPTSHVAEMLGISQTRVKQLAKRERVGSKFGSMLVFTENEIERLRVRKRLMPGQTRHRQPRPV